MQRVIKNNSPVLIIRELDYKLNYKGPGKPYYFSTLKIKTPPTPTKKTQKTPKYPHLLLNAVLLEWHIRKIRYQFHLELLDAADRPCSITVFWKDKDCWEIGIWASMNEVLEKKVVLKCWRSTKINFTTSLQLNLCSLCKYGPTAGFRTCYKENKRRNRLTTNWLFFITKPNRSSLKFKRKEERKNTVMVIHLNVCN